MDSEQATPAFANSSASSTSSPCTCGPFQTHACSIPDAHQIRDPRTERAINSALELQSFLCTQARIEEFLPNIVTRVMVYDAALPIDAPKWQADARVAARSRPGFMEAAGRGHKHACRETRSNLGLSHSEIVNRIRMAYAAMCSGGSEAPVEDIANDGGIENSSYF